MSDNRQEALDKAYEHAKARLVQAAGYFGLEDSLSFTVEHRYRDTIIYRMYFGDLHIARLRIPYVYARMQITVYESYPLADSNSKRILGGGDHPIQPIPVGDRLYRLEHHYSGVAQDRRKEPDEEYYLHPHINRAGDEGAFCGPHSSIQSAFSEGFPRFFQQVFFMVNSYVPDGAHRQLPVFYRCAATGEHTATRRLPASMMGLEAYSSHQFEGSVAFSDNVMATCRQCGTAYPLAIMVDGDDVHELKKKSRYKDAYYLYCPGCASRIREHDTHFFYCDACEQIEMRSYTIGSVNHTKPLVICSACYDRFDSNRCYHCGDLSLSEEREGLVDLFGVRGFVITVCESCASPQYESALMEYALLTLTRSREPLVEGSSAAYYLS